MKRTTARLRIGTVVLLLMAAAALILVIDGCSLFGVSKEERISLFLDDLNQDPRPNSIRDHFSSAATDYPTITGAFFDTDFPTDSIPYSVSIAEYSTNPVSGTVSGTGGSFGGPFSIEFTMDKDGFDWYILKLVLDGTTVVVE